jgi:hypothetical protein
MSEQRQVWKFSVIVQATESEADELGAAIARVLCPDDDHDGPCPVPWTVIRSGFEHVDADEAILWHESFAAERMAVDDSDQAVR